MCKDQLDELCNILTSYLKMNKARMKCLTGMVIALLQAKSVSLSRLSALFPGKAKIESCQRRMHRFIREVRIDYDLLAEFIMSLFDFADKEIYLTLDRTNWKLGKKNINFLVLGVVYQGAAIPVYWMLLNKRGNSNCRERIELVKRFTDKFPGQKIAGIIGDREFIGDVWLSWLNASGISYYMRIKTNRITTNSRGAPVDVDGLFYHLKTGESRLLKGRRKLGRQQVYLSGLRLGNGEILILASNVENPNAVKIYAMRWEIESLFQDMKGRGFNLEDTHVTNLRRLKTLFVIPVIAFCWSHKCGEYRRKEQAIKIKKHGRPAMSVFRFGLDFLTSKLFNFVSTAKRDIRKVIQLLNCNNPYAGATT